MMTRPADEISAAVLDTILSLEIAEEDGGADRADLELAVAVTVPPNVALDRYYQDHPGAQLDNGEKFNAIKDGKALLAAEAVAWLLDHDHLALAGSGRIRIGSKPLSVHPHGKSDKARQQYVPGTNYESDLFHGALRRVHPARVKLIRDSIASLGDFREFFPVLLDENDEAVDGRHRLAIDPEWPKSPRRVPVGDRFIVAAAANRVNTWSPDDWDRLRKLAEDQHGRKKASRALARLALLEDHERSDRDIGKLVGASPTTIGNVRSLLVATDQIGQWSHPRSKASLKVVTADHPDGESGVTTRDQAVPTTSQVKPSYTPVQVEALHAEIRRRLDAGEPTSFRQLMTEFGMGQTFVQGEIKVVKALLAAEQEALPAPPQPAAVPVFSSAPEPVPALAPAPEPVHQHAPARRITYCSCGLPLEDVIL